MFSGIYQTNLKISTAIIGILNNKAIAIADNSPVILYKGKIFILSIYHPVGFGQG
jgi:hypothetical protein